MYLIQLYSVEEINTERNLVRLRGPVGSRVFCERTTWASVLVDQPTPSSSDTTSPVRGANQSSLRYSFRLYAVESDSSRRRALVRLNNAELTVGRSDSGSFLPTQGIAAIDHFPFRQAIRTTDEYRRKLPIQNSSTQLAI